MKFIVLFLMLALSNITTHAVVGYIPIHVDRISATNSIKEISFYNPKTQTIELSYKTNLVFLLHGTFTFPKGTTNVVFTSRYKEDPGFDPWLDFYGDYPGSKKRLYTYFIGSYESDLMWPISPIGGDEIGWYLYEKVDDITGSLTFRVTVEDFRKQKCKFFAFWIELI